MSVISGLFYPRYLQYCSLYWDLNSHRGGSTGGGGAEGQFPPELPKRGGGIASPQLSHYHVMYTITYSHIIGLSIPRYVKCVMSLIIPHNGNLSMWSGQYSCYIARIRKSLFYFETSITIHEIINDGKSFEQLHDYAHPQMYNWYFIVFWKIFSH